MKFGHVSCPSTAEDELVGSRDRPHREAKKKPKEKTARPTLQPLTESPQNVELIRKPRKPRQVGEEQDQG